MSQTQDPRARHAAIDMAPDDFRAAGHELVDAIAGWLRAMPTGVVTKGEPPAEIRRVLDADRTLPEHGADPARLLGDAASMLFEHSLFNAHPRFFGYITSSPAPIGILADFLASALNQNMGAFTLAPMATEIEAQTTRWIAEL